MSAKYILAFESSCDDTSVAVVSMSYQVLSNLISSQPDHLAFGGVLPELASRLHIQNILHLTKAALNKAELQMHDIAAIAVSINPGLIGSLIVGLSFAKSLAWSLRIPLITVNHMLSHVFANYIDHPDIRAPFVALVVSGGHTELVHFETETDFKVISKTLDDAAGETFDKTAKLLGLGFPGGPIIDKLAKSGDPKYVSFPRALKQKTDFNFSYSGLKTAVLTHVKSMDPNEVQDHLADLAASIQAAIIDPLITKTLRYAKQNNIDKILIAGGVAANSGLRSGLTSQAAKHGIAVYYPSLKLCMDNAAMVAAAAIPKFFSEKFSPLEINAFSTKGTKLL